MRAARLLLVAFALASCAEVGWHKAGGDAAALPNDLANCRVFAQGRISRTLGPPVPASTDPRFGADMTQRSGAARLIEEQELVDRCMREKGYTLVPAGR